MTAADRDREAFEACQYAERLAASMHAKHYSDNTTWRPLSGDLIGLLTQIDNMAAGLTHARAQAGEPVAYIQAEILNELRKDKHATGTVCSGLLKKPFGNPIPLYTHPAPAQDPVAVPGWKLVPIDATDEMLEAAWDSDAADYVGEHKRIHCLADAWTAMLAAAPVSPPADSGEEREKLSEIIKTRLLGVLANEQDVVLEDADWRVILSALAAPPQAQDFAKGAEAWQPTHRHVKRGSTYRVIGEAEAQVSTGGKVVDSINADKVGKFCRDLYDGLRLTIYQGEDGKLWVRFTDEFNDGRFEPLPTQPGEG